MPPSVRPFRFALQLVRDEDDADALRRTVAEAASIGFEEVYAPDHIGSIDPFAVMMAAAEASPTIRVGTMVLNNELHHPVMLARTVATVDRLTGGRVILGLGTGYMQSEHDATGIELRAPRERVDRFAESLVVLRSLLDSGASSFDGTHHHVAVESLGVSSVQSRIPFLVGGHGRRVVGLAARHADIFQFTGLTHGPGGKPEAGGFARDDVRTRAHWLEEAAGPRATDIERSTLVQVTAVGDDAVSVRARTAEQLAMSVETIDECPFLLIGSVEQIIDKLERMRRDLGISHITVRHAPSFAPIVSALSRR